MVREEIPSAEVNHYAPELLGAVETICKSPPFRTSPKSCEFLQHIVQHTLRGNTGELKERLIGIALLGRVATYDTGSDSGVRVRANDVRKRLNAYNAANESDTAFTLDLPAGTYIPRFFRSAMGAIEPPPIAASARPPERHPSIGHGGGVPEPPNQPPPLSLWQLARPTLVALFLCTICMRWQLAQEHPFVTFWQTVFQDHHAVLFVPLSGTVGQPLISMQYLAEAAPLLTLAGQFHSHFTLAGARIPLMTPADLLVSIASPASDGSMQSPGIHPASFSGANLLVVERTAGGGLIVDHSAKRLHADVPGPAALLTIIDGPQESILIDGTDDATIRSLIQRLCERSTFPEQLADSFESGTVTQVVFPTAPQAEPMVFHEALPVSLSTPGQSH